MEMPVKFPVAEQRSLVNAGIYSHSGDTGSVPVMNFWEKLQLYSQPNSQHKQKRYLLLIIEAIVT